MLHLIIQKKVSNKISLLKLYLEFITNNRIVVYNLSDHVEELNDLLGHVIAWSSLPSDHHSSSNKRSSRVTLYSAL